MKGGGGREEGGGKGGGEREGLPWLRVRGLVCVLGGGGRGTEVSRTESASVEFSLEFGVCRV